MSLSIIRRVFLIGTVYYALAFILISCCNCENVLQRTIRWTGLSISGSAYRVEPDGTVVTEENASMDFSQKQYSLRATVNYEFLVSNFPHHFSMFNEAYACKCEESTVLTQKSVTEIKVVSVNDYDATHPAGSDITSYFGSVKSDKGGADGIGPLQLYYGSTYSGRLPYTGYDFYMVQRPSAGTVQQFNVIVMFSDSSSYGNLTPVLRF